MGYRNGIKITVKEKAQEKWEAKGRPRLIWNTGTYERKKHGEIGSKRIGINS